MDHIQPRAVEDIGQLIAYAHDVIVRVLSAVRIARLIMVEPCLSIGLARMGMDHKYLRLALSERELRAGLDYLRRVYPILRLVLYAQPAADRRL